MTLTFKENSDLKKLITGDGKEVKHSQISKAQLDSLEDFINYKLHEIKWWDGLDMKPKGRILISKIIDDRDALFLEYTQPNNDKIYQFLSDCDRYIFTANIVFNSTANEFYFIEEEGY